MTPMSYDDKIKWLRRYQDSLRRERELAEEVQQMQSRACKVTPALMGMPGGGGDGQSLPRAVEGIIRAQQELQAQINLCGAIRREIVAVLVDIQSPRDREILRRRYILGQRWEEIAVEMHLEYRWVTRRHHNTVDKLKLTPESPI